MRETAFRKAIEYYSGVSASRAGRKVMGAQRLEPGSHVRSLLYGVTAPINRQRILAAVLEVKPPDDDRLQLATIYGNTDFGGSNDVDVTHMGAPTQTNRPAGRTLYNSMLIGGEFFSGNVLCSSRADVPSTLFDEYPIEETFPKIGPLIVPEY